MKLTKELVLKLIKEQGNKIKIPDIYTKINNFAFSDIEAIEEVTFPTDLEIICKYSFLRSNIKRIKFTGNKLKTIEDFAFYECNNLKKINLPDSIREIGSGVFAGCSNLEHISFPKNIQSIGMGVTKDTKLPIQNLGREIIDKALNFFLSNKPTNVSLCTLLTIMSCEVMIANRTFIDFQLELPDFNLDTAKIISKVTISPDGYWWEFNEEGNIERLNYLKWMQNRI